MANRVLIVDDSESIRAALNELISGETDFELVGIAENGREAIAVARRVRPDLIILDLSMPVMTGIEAAPYRVEILLAAIIILFTMYISEQVTAEAERVGIHAVVSKGTPHKLFPRARSLLNAA